jgi:protein TonB
MPQAATRGERGRVVARFTILRDGKVQDLQLVIQSGNEALDLAVQAAINRSSPFAPLPADFKRDRIVLQLPFLYNMKSGDR